MKYEHYNQIDYTLRIGSVKGHVKDRDGFVVSTGCVGVFTETGEKLIRATHTDEDGHFEIGTLTNGKYRLVISADGFCAANGIILLKNKQKGKKRLHTIMKPRGIDDCSYIELR